MAHIWADYTQQQATGDVFKFAFCTRRVVGQLLNHTEFNAETPYNTRNKQHPRKHCVLREGQHLSNQNLLTINHFTRISVIGINPTSTSLPGEIMHIDALWGINRSPFLAERLVSCAKCLGQFTNFIFLFYFWESSDYRSQFMGKQPHTKTKFIAVERVRSSPPWNESTPGRVSESTRSWLTESFPLPPSPSL